MKKRVISGMSKGAVKMMWSAVIFFLGVAVATALPTTNEQRIVGGEVTTIERYPYSVALLSSLTGVLFAQSCGGTLINNRSVLTAAHCFIAYRWPFHWRSRMGSTFASQGGSVFASADIIRHPDFHTLLVENDFAILRISGSVPFSNTIQPGRIAGPNYNAGDNQEVWAIGWGTTCHRGCSSSEQLRHVQIWTINQEVCRQRYAVLGYNIADNMLCTGWLDVGGRDMCQGDSGGPVLHQGVVIGVCSWGQECAHPFYPGVNARVSAASNWITTNA